MNVGISKWFLACFAAVLVGTLATVTAPTAQSQSKAVSVSVLAYHWNVYRIGNIINGGWDVYEVLKVQDTGEKFIANCSGPLFEECTPLPGCISLDGSSSKCKPDAWTLQGYINLKRKTIALSSSSGKDYVFRLLPWPKACRKMGSEENSCEAQ